MLGKVGKVDLEKCTLSNPVVRRSTPGDAAKREEETGEEQPISHKRTLL
jgi:hypothetical protein